MRGHGGRGGGWVGGGGITRGPAPGYSSGGGNFDDGGLMWAGQSMHPNEIRRQETLERARMEQMRQKSMVSGGKGSAWLKGMVRNASNTGIPKHC